MVVWRRRTRRQRWLKGEGGGDSGGLKEEAVVARKARMWWQLGADSDGGDLAEAVTTWW